MNQQQTEAVQAVITPENQLVGNQNRNSQQKINTEQYFTFVYSTVNQFIKKHPAFTSGGMRALIFNENSNGLAKAGAIIRLGRKVLIDESKFFAWVESQNQGGAK